VLFRSVPNINSPKACVITKQGKRIYSDRLTERTDPRGERYFWISGEPSAHAEEGTDIDAVAKGCVSVTPLHLDMTNMDALEAISKWFL
jgi:5'-nucleotidase